jgi:hypothetical protein
MYSLVYATEQDAFLTSIRDIFSDNLTLDECQAICRLITSVAFNNRSVFGPRGALELAKIAAQHSGFAEIAEQELVRHIEMFQNVVKDGDSLVIGTIDGWIYAFKKRKMQLEVKVCEGAIDCVSIGPGNWVLAISLQGAIGKVIPLAKVGLFRPKERIIQINVDEWNDGCEIVWQGPEADDVIVRPTKGK